MEDELTSAFSECQHNLTFWARLGSMYPTQGNKVPPTSSAPCIASFFTKTQGPEEG